MTCDLTLAFIFVPRFLSMLEEEVYSQNSPIWDQDFLSASSRTSQLGIQTGEKKKKIFFSCINQNTTRKCLLQFTVHLFAFFIKKLKTRVSKEK